MRVSGLPSLDTSAERSLEKALECLRSGLAISAWMWASKAEALLDAHTNGEVTSDGDGKEQG